MSTTRVTLALVFGLFAAVHAASTLGQELGGQELAPVALPPVGEDWLAPGGLDPTQVRSVAETNPMLWRQYQSLGSPTVSTGGACSSCGGATGYNRCGCSGNVFPWSDGPGNCDSFCVGPKWAVELEGLVLFREDADWASVAAVVPDQTLEEQFDHGPGQRVYVTGYNCHGFGLQVGYEGVNNWVARSEFDFDDGSNTGDRRFDLDSTFNSVEINVLRATESPWKFFGGFRYVQLDEDLRDFTTLDKPIPPPVVAPGPGTAFVDSGTDFLLSNRLIGFQAGLRRSRWELNRWVSFDLFGNAGVYCNKFKREDVGRTVTTVLTADDLSTVENEFSQTVTEVNSTLRRDITAVSYFGEAGASALIRVNHCVALRGGYQVVAVDNVGQALDAFFAPGLTGSTQVYHGWRFGLEYRR